MKQISQRTNYSIILYIIIIDLYMISIFNGLMGIPTIPISIRKWLSYILVACTLFELLHNANIITYISTIAMCYAGYVLIGCFLKDISLQDILSYIFFPLTFVLFFEVSKRSNYKDMIGLLQSIQFVLLCYLAAVFFMQQIILGIGARNRINSVYYVVTTFAFVVNSKKRLIWLTSSIISVLLAVLSLKLGACLCVAVALIINMVKKSSNKKQTLSTIFKYIILISLVFLIINFVASNFFDIYIFDKIEESSSSGGSGRLDLWKNTLQAFWKSSLEQKIFGNFTPSSSASISSHSAHNDYLELIWRLGLVGCILFVHFICKIFQLHIKSNKNEYAQDIEPLITLLILMFISQLLFIPAYSGLLGMGIGVYVAQCIKQPNNKQGDIVIEKYR